MTKELEEYSVKLRDAISSGEGYGIDGLMVRNAAQALLRVIDSLGDEKDEDSDTNVGMMSLGRVRGYNALRQQIIDAILNKGGGEMTTNKDIEIVRRALELASFYSPQAINYYKTSLEALTRIESALAERNGGMVFSGNDTIVPPKGEKR